MIQEMYQKYRSMVFLHQILMVYMEEMMPMITVVQSDMSLSDMAALTSEKAMKLMV